MEAFYTIIYVKPISLTDEHLAVGVFLGGGEGPYFYLSEKRLKLLKNTVHRNTFLSLQRHLKSLKQKIDSYRNSNQKLMLFDPHYSKEEFLRLNKQSKGAVLYSEPVTVNEWLNDSFYKQFVQTFLGDKIVEDKSKRPLFHLKWKAFYHSSKFSDWEKDIAINQLNNNVEMSFKVDLINHSKKSAIQTIDFNLSKSNVFKKKYELELTAQLLPEYEVFCVYPTPAKQIAKDVFQSTKDALKHISFVKFSEFKLNH